MIHQVLSGPLVRPAGLVSDDDVRAINRLSNPPPVPVSARDVYVRRCRLAGDAVDSYFGCFRTADLPRLLALVQGAPLLVGHDKRSLGVARFFGGSVEPRGAHRYVMPQFYWLRSHSSAEDLRVAIDGGIYSEASISFTYRTPACSVCGQDIRACEHLPGTLGPEGKPVFYWYDEVEAVLEGSLVYRGAEPGTGFELARKRSRVPGLPGKDDFFFTPPTLRLKLDGAWYRAPLVREEDGSTE
ncbi:MAG: hypothetical protein C4524_08530 [Candidatus Zixiibacteriota bacterium]|nr:MAG: hypothetical protein C4524_08530 [candidate division Zixibacteria bacterium]